jgi:hypothetical protein
MRALRRAGRRHLDLGAEEGEAGTAARPRTLAVGC